MLQNWNRSADGPPIRKGYDMEGKSWHTVTAVVTREYSVPVYAADPAAAIAALDDWISDDFAPHEISAKWELEAK